ncbi:DUF1543 domain-containing protein [Gallaecimonas pentaromativorans]|uniref:DUF1543 domain-containing protein n=1 Tax=Gallaecimonas pentaromativorans TaxID=584787 RepID=UPI003A8C9A2A
MLYVVMLGGRHPKAKIEVHDVVFAVADSFEDSFEQLKSQWFGDRQGLHIDSWMAVDGVEQYQVTLADSAPGPDDPRLFFINLGGYLEGGFGEVHDYLLVVAGDKAEAKQKGKAMMDSRWDKPHTDALLDVDDCIPIDCVQGRYISLEHGPHNGVIAQSDYIIL